MKLETVKAGELKFDEELLDLRTVDTHTVSRYRQALRHGEAFPPLIVDGASIVISGNHRLTAYLQEFGPDHMVEVEQRKCKTRGDRLCLFAEENTRHGKPLDGFSLHGIILRLTDYNVKPEKIAKIFYKTPKAVQRLAEMYCVVIGEAPQYRRGERRVPIKHGMAIEPKSTISHQEYKEHKKLDLGEPPWRLAEQLTRHLDRGRIRKEDERVQEALRALHKALENYFELQASREP